ncbi:hypothetical protein D9619_008716 [Psilocybe cf. subviscida]|uniref:NAD-dependent epimerase/dehydratase domain-containing protein n=1 Tax=Psilocybe cf. subviscida TaxID=2480587 RepID=A0A8H5F0T5_9AGAR|nr:hypothetical protein D9619_008716 [Psilocybe cf. subviscida]
MSSVVLITGAAGFLGGLLSSAIHHDSLRPGVKLILADVVEPKAPAGSTATVLKADLTDTAQVESLFATSYGIPDVVYCLHGIMSRGSEDNFDLGVKINVDSVRMLLEAARKFRRPQVPPIKFVFTSSLAVYGGPLPDIITPFTAASPQGSYGFAKLTSELIINEYTRRGWVDGRILRLPTIVVRSGAPAGATSSFISGIIREPLQGQKAICPIGNSIDSPELSLRLWLASPQTTIRNLVIASHIKADKFMTHTRVVCLPGFTATVRDELDALLAIGGPDALERVVFEDDPVNRRIVSSWPSAFDNSYALSLGFLVDEGGMLPIVKQFQTDLALDSNVL